MRLTEQKLWDTLKRHAPRRLRLQRVENRVGEGMPDVYVGWSGKWVELKSPAKLPVSATVPILPYGKAALRPSQIAWHYNAAMNPAAPHSYVLIRLPTNALYLVPGLFATRLNEMTLEQLTLYAVATTWDAIVKELS